MSVQATRVSRISWRKIAEEGGTYLLLSIVLIIMMTPILWLILTSIRPFVEITSTRLILVPRRLVLENYLAVFRDYEMSAYLKNTLIVCGGVIVTNLVIGPPAAYAMSRYQFRGERVVFFGLVFMRMIPLVAVILPLFIIFSTLRMLNSYNALIVAHTAFKLPVTIWLLRAFIADLPRELDDSARVDGASPLGGHRTNHNSAHQARPGRHCGAGISGHLE